MTPELWAKWGRPKNLGPDDNGFRYQCQECGAGWVGPNGDTCYWCHKRWTIKQADDRQALLVPEWLTWGERYSGAKAIDREVWANTRGFRGDFESPWIRRLVRARDDGTISTTEAVGAVNRYRRWKLTHLSTALNH